MHLDVWPEKASDMKRVFHVVKKEFLQMKRDRRMVGMLFAAPILQLVLLGYAASLDIKNIPMVVCDLDNSKQSRELIEHYSGSGYFNLVGQTQDVNAIDGYFRRGEAGIGLIIPVNFGPGPAGRERPSARGCGRRIRFQYWWNRIELCEQYCARLFACYTGPAGGESWTH